METRAKNDQQYIEYMQHQLASLHREIEMEESKLRDIDRSTQTLRDASRLMISTKEVEYKSMAAMHDRSLTGMQAIVDGDRQLIDKLAQR